MIKRIALAAAALSALSACDMAEMAVNQTAEDAARPVVEPIVASTVPGAVGGVLTDCILENATSTELATIAAQGGTDATVLLVSDILARSETVACATSGLAG